MSPRETHASDTAVAIEHLFDVTTLTYKGVHVWPLIRHLIFHPLKMRPPSEYATPDATAIACRAADATRARNRPPLSDADVERLIAARTAARRTPPRTDLLVLTRGLENRVLADGTVYNPLIDPYLEALDESVGYVKIELADQVTEIHANRSRPTLLVPNSIPDPAIGLRDNSAVANWPALQMLFNRFGVSAPSQDVVRRFMEEVLAYADLFTPYLRQLKPRAAALACYYTHAGYGLCVAATRSGIPTVDIQHGGNSDRHINYTLMSRFPQGGYDLLPDIFWTWSDYPKRKFEETLPDPAPPHLAITGGCMTLGARAVARQLQGRNAPEEDALLDDLARFDKVVLVGIAMLPAGTDLVGYVIQAMRSAPRSWCWVFRHHPVHSTDADMDACKRRLADAGLDTWRVDGAHTIPLPRLLSVCDHLCTTWSGICFDALAWTVPVTCVDPIAMAWSPDAIERGYFMMAEDPAHLVDLVRAHGRGSLAVSEATPVTAPARAAEVWSLILADRPPDGRGDRG